MHEQHYDSDVEQLDLAEAYRDLRPRLADFSSSPDAIAAFGLLGEIAGRKILFSTCVELARTQLENVADEHVRSLKGQFSAQVYQSYPAGSESAPELTSPKRFIKDHGLNGMIRPELRDAQAHAVAQSKERLVTAVKEDTNHEDLGLGISDEELESAMVGKVEARLTEVRGHIGEIKELMPIVETPAIQIGSNILETMNEHEVIFIPSVTAPAEPKQRAQLDNAIFALKKLLQEFSDGESTIARQLVEQYTPRVQAYLDCKLVTRYEQLEADELAGLPAAVEAAYTAAAHLGPSYQPKLPAADESAPDTVAAAGAPTANVRIAERPAESRTRHTVEVKNPFDWYDKETISLDLTQEAGQTLVSTVAMTPNMRAVSKKIRDTDSPMTKRFDDIWTMIQEVELQGEAHNHGLIQSIRTDFNDLSVYYFKNRRRNGARLYYARTKLSRLPELAAITHGAGIAEDTDLIILLAETDKARQPKVLQELNAAFRAPGQRD